MYMYILHRYASATEMGLQHTCDVAWMVLCMECLQQIQKRSGSRGVYAKCNLQIICKCFTIIAGCLLVFTHS